MKVVLGMPFIIFSNVDIQFAKKKLTWRTYTTKKAPTTHWVKLIDQKKFAKKNVESEYRGFYGICELLEINNNYLASNKSSDGFAIGQKSYDLDQILEFRWYVLKRVTKCTFKANRNQWIYNHVEKEEASIFWAYLQPRAGWA